MSPIVISVAGHTVPDPVARFAAYARRNDKTVRVYDLGPTGDPDVITADEIRRTLVIHSRIGGQQPGHFLQAGAQTQPLLAAIPARAHLREADPAGDGGLYDQALAVHELLLAPRIRTSKVSKVLHLKRPHLFPILDLRVVRLYRRAAEAAAARHPQRGYRRMFWAAVRDDVIDPANVEALQRVRRLLGTHEDERVRRIVALSDVRLLDILARQRGA
ncbi:DUF6308 family protein [Symbioplanes lichenis]|uniref:DUF6308 family protein n=1 Tax=Symbioplanes lichenis TaxID=1629072 RepID=UPI002739EE65|nr:DUF6308 family protein [Actinoplanes lichenis]